MIKVNILNLNGFLETVNQCSGSVMILCPNGNNMDIIQGQNQFTYVLKQWNNILSTANSIIKNL